MRRKRVKIGDIIAIPIDEKRNVFGQFVEGNVLGFYIIYDLISEGYPALEQIVSKPILLRAFTNDRLITDGYWKVIGNLKVPDGVKIPEFKVDFVENGIKKCMIARYDGSILRPATEQDRKTLETMKSYTPNFLEDAIKAKYGLLPWLPNYDNLIYKRFD